jgi:hypothetical protein
MSASARFLSALKLEAVPLPVFDVKEYAPPVVGDDSDKKQKTK